MFTQPIDIDAYFKRIGFNGQPKVDLETLNQLHILHVKKIPFENITPFLGGNVCLDQTSLHNKILRDGRGGYCFEQNILFGRALSELGFQVAGLAARVRWNVPGKVRTRRSHMLLLIRLNGQRYIVDVGFGGMTLTGAILLDTEEAQETPHEPYRIIKENEEYRLDAKVAGQWKALYVFDLQEQYLPDYETMNWYMSTFPEGHFVTEFTVVRPDENCRYALYNNRLSMYHLHQPSEKKWFKNEKDILETLVSIFHIELNNDTYERLGKKLSQKLAL